MRDLVDRNSNGVARDSRVQKRLSCVCVPRWESIAIADRQRNVRLAEKQSRTFSLPVTARGFCCGRNRQDRPAWRIQRGAVFTASLGKYRGETYGNRAKVAEGPPATAACNSIASQAPRISEVRALPSIVNVRRQQVSTMEYVRTPALVAGTLAMSMISRQR